MRFFINLLKRKKKNRAVVRTIDFLVSFSLFMILFSQFLLLLINTNFLVINSNNSEENLAETLSLYLLNRPGYLDNVGTNWATNSAIPDEIGLSTDFSSRLTVDLNKLSRLNRDLPLISSLDLNWIDLGESDELGLSTDFQSYRITTFPFLNVSVNSFTAGVDLTAKVISYDRSPVEGIEVIAQLFDLVTGTITTSSIGLSNSLGITSNLGAFTPINPTLIILYAESPPISGLNHLSGSIIWGMGWNHYIPVLSPQTIEIGAISSYINSSLTSISHYFNHASSSYVNASSIYPYRDLSGNLALNTSNQTISTLTTTEAQYITVNHGNQVPYFSIAYYTEGTIINYHIISLPQVFGTKATLETGDFFYPSLEAIEVGNYASIFSENGFKQNFIFETPAFSSRGLMWFKFEVGVIE